MKPAYLIAGDDEAKITATLRRLRERAEREGGAAGLQSFSPESGAGPDPDALIDAIATMSLTVVRRYLLAEGVDGWGKAQVSRVAEALGSIPEDTTVVLISRAKATAALADAVKKAGGEVLSYGAPKTRALPKSLVAEASARGFSLDLDAARVLVERLGSRPLRLAHELDRLALWAGESGSVKLEDLEEMIVDTSEAAAWSLADAVVEGDAAGALIVAERLIGRGESVTGLSYLLSSRLRAAARAAAELDSGRSPKQVADVLGMHPYAAKMLVKRLADRPPPELRGAVGAIADLEMWCRGGSDYSEDVALTLALGRATAAGYAESLAT